MYDRRSNEQLTETRRAAGLSPRAYFGLAVKAREAEDTPHACLSVSLTTHNPARFRPVRAGGPRSQPSFGGRCTQEIAVRCDLTCATRWRSLTVDALPVHNDHRLDARANVLRARKPRGEALLHRFCTACVTRMALALSERATAVGGCRVCPERWARETDGGAKVAKLP